MGVAEFAETGRSIRSRNSVCLEGLLWTITMLVLAFGVVGCSSTSGLSTCSNSSCSPGAAVRGKVQVSGVRLLRDGVPWTPHGFVQIAFVAPPAAQTGVFLTAYQNYDPSEYAVMAALGADTVRMQVSQPGLDPSLNNPLFSKDFLTSVQNAVFAARAAGLNVIVSVQDEEQSGEDPNKIADLPNCGTNRVWAELAPLFKGDTGILFEMLNEPNRPANPSNYALWESAMNTTISTIRATGATNVVVADGLNYALQLGGAPFLTDLAHEVAYAEHPYFHSKKDQQVVTWDSRFGDFAATAPVIITEWAPVASASKPGSTFYCDSDTAKDTVQLFQYLQSKGIGITNYAYDFSGNLFGSALYGFPPVPSSFAKDAQCGDVGYGPGKVIESWYSSGTVPSTLL